MSTTANRLLQELALLASRPAWSASELAAATGVGERTIRNDVARLRELGYPVEATPGRHGGYRFGGRGGVPPLLLTEPEAVAVAVALGLARTTPGIADDALTALTKLDQTLPDEVRGRVHSLHDHLDVSPATDRPDAAASVSSEVLARIGVAIRDHQGLRVSRPGDDRPREVDPYRLVSWEERWYLVARNRRDGRFEALRVDLLELHTPDASRFTPRPMRGDAYARFVLRTVARSGWAVHASVRVDAPAEVVRQRINPAVGIVEEADEAHSILHTGADSWSAVAVWIGLLDLDFHVDGPPELIAQLRLLSARYADAVRQPPAAAAAEDEALDA